MTSSITFCNSVTKDDMFFERASDKTILPGIGQIREETAKNLKSSSNVENIQNTWEVRRLSGRVLELAIGRSQVRISARAIWLFRLASNVQE